MKANMIARIRPQSVNKNKIKINILADSSEILNKCFAQCTQLGML